MLKKRGKLRAFALLSLGIIITVLFISFFFVNKPQERLKTYALTDEEKTLLQVEIDEAKLEANPACKAFLKKDIAMCQEVEDTEDKRDCTEYISRIMLIKYHNENYTGYFTNVIEKGAWESFLRGTLNCANIAGNEGAFCAAIVNKDISHCERIDSEETKEYCKGESGLVIAILNDNECECNNLPQEELREYCKAWITEEVKSCINERITVTEDSITRMTAVEIRNENICYAINMTRERERCIFDIATTKKDALLCKDIISSELRKSCGVIISKDKNLCNTLQDEEAKRLCYENIK